jgi:hypothetical protein
VGIPTAIPAPSWRPLLRYNNRVGNHAYLSLWLDDPSESALLENFQRFLGTIPFSKRRPSFTELIVRAVSPAESPLMERDLRSADMTAGGDAGAVTAMIAELLHSDSSYEVGAWWDLWTYTENASENGVWKLQPQPLLLVCKGEDYDDGIAREAGHIQADIGFEHLFTGPAEPLGGAQALVTPGAFKRIDQTGERSMGKTEDRVHAAQAVKSPFMATMTGDEHRNVYREKTAANARVLLDWVERVRASLPVKRFQLWSEEEENFEAQLEEIVAAG